MRVYQTKKFLQSKVNNKSKDNLQKGIRYMQNIHLKYTFNGQNI